MSSLFFYAMRYDPKHPKAAYNDRFVLSKVGVCVCVYVFVCMYVHICACACVTDSTGACSAVVVRSVGGGGSD